MSDKSCKERIRGEYKDRMKDLKKLWKAYRSGNEEVEDLGSFHEYGLGFWYVPEGTFRGQREAFFCYQLSTGGPQDEFRFFVNPSLKPHRIEYWFLDWFDGAHIVLKGKDEEFLKEIFGFFAEIGAVEAEYEKAVGR